MRTYYLSHGVILVGGAQISDTAKHLCTDDMVTMVIMDGSIEWFCNNTSQGSGSLADCFGVSACVHACVLTHVHACG